MVHELLGIQNGLVDMSETPDVSPDMKQVVMNINNDVDSFFQKNAYLDLGDLGANLKSYVDEFQGKHKSATAKLDSISDMKRFVETYPEFRRASKEVGKHVSVVSEVSRLVAQNKLLELGEVEQNCAVGSGGDVEFRSVLDMVRRADLGQMDRVRLVCTFAAKNYFQVLGNAPKQQTGAERVLILVEALARSGVSPKVLSMIPSFCQYMSAGVTVSKQQPDDIKSFFSNISKSITSAQSKLRGVDNVYTQYRPRLETILDGILRGDFAGYDGSGSFAPRVQDVIVFVVGGVTYEEARSVASFNDSVGKSMGVRVIVGGTSVINGDGYVFIFRLTF
jgi:vacuolar protein sorting-associated protein 45